MKFSSREINFILTQLSKNVKKKYENFVNLAIDLSLCFSYNITVAKGYSSIGRVVVSKTIGSGFES